LKQIDSELLFTTGGSGLSLSFITPELLDRLYSQYVGSEEKTQCGVIASLLSHIPLDLTDLQNRRVLRDLRNDALQTMNAKSLQCFESIKDSSIADYFHSFIDAPARAVLLRKLIQVSSAGLILHNNGNETRKHHLVGFLEGTYPQSPASQSLIKELVAAGAEGTGIADIADEFRIVSVHLQAGVSVQSLLEEEEWLEHYRRLLQTRHLHIEKDDEKFIALTEDTSLNSLPANI
jgi:hypothetical protein